MRTWRALGGLFVRRTSAVLATVLVVTVVLAVGLPRLGFETGEDTIISPDSEAYRDNLRYQSSFGGEPMLVLFTGDIADLTSPANLARLRALEEDLRASGEFPAVLGPWTALEYAYDQLEVAPGMLLAAAERQTGEAREAYDAKLQSELGRLGAVGAQTLDNPKFVDFLLYEADGSIRAALRDNFPDPNHAVMVVRAVGNASMEELGSASDTVKDIVARHPVPGFDVVATGPPTLLKHINDYLQGGMATLGGIAVVVMLLVLAAVFRVRWPLLPLGVVAIGSVWAFGLVGLAGIPLTMVTISGLPILIGLGVDFAIQMHNRFEEEIGRGADGPEAVRRAMAHMAPPLALAMIAAVAGFVSLQGSPVPMLRDFGRMLSIGVVVLVVTAIVVPTVLLLRRERRRPTPAMRRGMRGQRLERMVRWMTSMRPSWVVPIVVVVLAAAGAGLALEDRVAIQTDPERWVDQSSAVIQELEDLRVGTGFSSELGILVEADDVTDEAVVSWMYEFATEQIEKHPGALLRAASLPHIAEAVTGVPPVASDVDQVMSVAPRDILVSFVDDDRTTANLIFPVAPGVDREALLDDVTRDLRPPEGVTATPSGLLVVGVELINGLEADRGTMTLLSLLAVFLWLSIAYRSVRAAVLPLVPVVVAVGLSSLGVWVFDIELTPLTTVTGPLVIAVSTEFAVLVAARYREERAAGRAPRDAVRFGLVRIGRAFVASGLTLVAGFGVLAFAAMPLLREFGVLVALNVLLALVSALVLLPPLLVWADGRPRRTGLRRQRRTQPPEPDGIEIELPPVEERELVTTGARRRER